MNTLKLLAGITACLTAGYLLSLPGKGEPQADPAPAVTPVSAEAPAPAVAVPLPVPGNCGDERCDCYPPCHCEKIGECLKPKAAEPKLAQPEQTCTACNGAGATRVNGAWARCGVCGGDGTIDDDPRDPEAQPGFKPTALYTEPQAAPQATPTEYVTVQQAYRYGFRGRRTGYRNVTMTRAAYEAQCANGNCGR